MLNCLPERFLRAPRAVFFAGVRMDLHSYGKMPPRCLGLCLGMFIWVSLAAVEPPVKAQPAGTADAGAGFRLEGKPSIDDVFGDASDYRRTIDRVLELIQTMQAMRDDF